MLQSRLTLYFIVLVLLLGCSSAPIITQHEVLVPYYVPAIHDTITLADTVIAQDTLWYGSVTDSVGEIIGDLKVYFNRKIAELKLNEKVDTVRITVTDTVNVAANSIMPVVNSMLTWWERSIIYLVLGLTLGGIIYLRIKRGKVI